jgi:hypothetical protein
MSISLSGYLGAIRPGGTVLGWSSGMDCIEALKTRRGQEAVRGSDSQDGGRAVGL